MPEYEQLFQNKTTQHADVAPARIIFHWNSDSRTIMRLFPKQNPDITLEEMGYAMSRQQSSVDIAVVGYALYLCGNKLMDEHQLKSFTDYLLRNGTTDLYKLLSDIKSPHLRCFEEYLLLYAAREDRYDIVEALKLRGMNLSLPVHPFPPIRTALQEAIMYGNVRFCRKLVEDGVDVDCVSNHSDDNRIGNDYTKKPIEVALEYLPEFLPTMIASSRVFPAADILPYMLQSSKDIEIETVRGLLAQGADIDAIDAQGWSSLQLAIKSRNFVLAKFLVQKGADPNGLNPARILLLGAQIEAGRYRLLDYWKSPLSLAAAANSIDMIEVLLKAGADINLCQCDAFEALLESKYYGIEGFVDSRLVFASALQVATLNDQFEAIESLLDHGADVESCHGATPLMIAACEVIDTQETELLLQHGASVNAKLEEHPTNIDALGFATRSKNIGVIEALIFAGADLNSPVVGEGGRTPLQRACQEGNLEAALRMLNHGADINAPCAEVGGITCLQAGARFGNISLVKMLLSWGADVQARPAHAGGETALSAAIRSWYLDFLDVFDFFDFFDVLINAGADVTLNGWQGGGINSIPVIAAMSWYDKGRRILLLQKLLSNGLDLATPVYFHRKLDAWAMQESTWMGLEDRRGVMSLGELALLEAMHRSAEDVVELLLQLNCPISENVALRALTLLSPSASWPVPIVESLWNMATCMRNIDGSLDTVKKDILHVEGIETLFCMACKADNMQILQFLIRKGVFKDDEYWDWDSHKVSFTPLQWACQDGRFEVIKLLLRHGSDVNVLPGPDTGRTALQGAAEKGHLSIVELLLNHGADVNASPAKRRGATALQAAAINGEMRIAQILIEAGADIGAQGARNYGRTAINGAAEHGRLDMVKLLLDFYKLKDGESISALCEEAASYAREECHWAVVELLENYQRVPCSSP